MKFSNDLTKFYNLEKINIVSSSCYYKTPSWPDPNLPEYIYVILKIKPIES